MLEEPLRLLFLYLVEVAGHERRRLSLLLADHLLLVEALGLVHDGHLSGDLALQGALFHCDGSLHGALLSKGPRLGWHLSLLPRHLVSENMLGSQHIGGVRSLRYHFNLPSRRRRDLESYILARLAHMMRQGYVLRVLRHLLGRKVRGGGSRGRRLG